MGLTEVEAKMTSMFVESVLYGAYVVLFIITSHVLVYRRPPNQPIRKLMISISIAMFVLASMHVAISFTRAYRGFVLHNTTPNGPGEYFDHLADSTQVFGSAIYIAQTLLGDGVMLLRCYIVWGRRWDIVVFPSLLWLGCVATGIGILYSFVRVEPNAQIFADELFQWMVSFFTMTLAANVICTFLVALRIWLVNRRSESYGTSSLRPITRIVVESGAVYSVTLFVLLMLYVSGCWFELVLQDAVSPIVGLVFSMIIIRIGLGITAPTGENRRTVYNAHDRSSVRFEPPHTQTIATELSPPRLCHAGNFSSTGDLYYSDGRLRRASMAVRSDPLVLNTGSSGRDETGGTPLSGESSAETANKAFEGVEP